MPGSLLEDVASLRERLAAFEPGEYTRADCARLADELASLEEGCTAARLLAAARAVNAGAHKGQGFNDANAWVARRFGTTLSQARQALDTARRLEECPDTRAALQAGEISLAQAAEITKAESETQGAESQLLPLARQTDLSRLRDHSRQYRQAKVDPTELRRRQFAGRHFRHWRDREGMVCFTGALPPETGLPFVRRVEATAVKLKEEAKRHGSAGQFDAYAADALAQLVASSTDGSKLASGGELVIVCDIFAWRRGTTPPLSRPHSTSAPCPPSPGANVWTAAAAGASKRPHQPCRQPRTTQYSNLAPRCYKDHLEKTDRDRRAGLLGPGPRPPNGS